MKTFFLLIVLAKNGAGDISASFVNTETLEQCQQKSVMLEGVFKASTIPVIESHCIKSDMRFSEFSHATSTGTSRSFYQLTFGDAKVVIETMPDWKVCVRAVDKSVGQSRVYCASSLQTIIE